MLINYLAELLDALEAGRRPPSSWPIFACAVAPTGREKIAFLVENHESAKEIERLFARWAKIDPSKTNLLKKVQETRRAVVDMNMPRLKYERFFTDGYVCWTDRAKAPDDAIAATYILTNFRIGHELYSTEPVEVRLDDLSGVDLSTKAPLCAVERDAAVAFVDLCTEYHQTTAVRALALPVPSIRELIGPEFYWR